jgi:hypothetical protein
VSRVSKYHGIEDYQQKIQLRNIIAAGNNNAFPLTLHFYVDDSHYQMTHQFHAGDTLAAAPLL